MIWVWGVLAASALLWPARTVGALDGLPLDRVVEAMLLGVVFPSLLWFHPRFLRTTIARGAIVALLLAKGVEAAVLVPDGWCVQLVPARPFVSDAASGVPHSWDVRADWLTDPPACSAIMRRPYNGFGEFPVWFFNLPSAGGGWPAEDDRPPGARTTMTVTGFVDAPRAGELRIDLGPDMADATTVRVDDRIVRDAVPLDAGSHRVLIESVLTGSGWRFVPLWNGADLWSSRAMATVRRPSGIDRILRPVAGWLVALSVTVLIGAWLGSFVKRIASTPIVAWTLAMSVSFAVLVAVDRVDAARWLVVALAGAALVHVPRRHRNLFGAFVLIGVPWLALVAASGAGDVGRFWLYGVGHDYWQFQRNAYRIVMQGYWLEGGSPTFWFQPLYRWIAGLLHLVFGDSSVGERFWDGACVLASALFAWRVADASAGFRAGLVAAVLTLSVFALGTPWPLIGQGLSEITSAGFVCLAAHVALTGRRGPAWTTVAAGICATLAFYARLNNLPMAAAVALFALSPRVSVRRVMTTAPWRLSVAWRTALVVPLVLGAGLLVFAWRTWHYTGVFSVFYGTQREFLAIWRPDVSAATALARGLSSAIMVLTVNDPARFDWRALPVLAGAAAAALALVGVPRLRDLPAAPVLFFLAGVAGAFVARGSAYPGRFSVHIIAVTCALTVCAAPALVVPLVRRFVKRDLTPARV